MEGEHWPTPLLASYEMSKADKDWLLRLTEYERTLVLRAMKKLQTELEGSEQHDLLKGAYESVCSVVSRLSKPEKF